MAILEVADLVTGYGDKEIIHGVDLTVGADEMVTLLGPNGAGKSTVMKAVFGLIPCWEGRVVLNGVDVTDHRPDEVTRVGASYVPQRNNVFPNLTVRENLEMGAFTAPDDFDVDAKIDEMGKIFPMINEKIDQDAGDLSGGQQQMVEFARGLMLDPDLLLLDEPTAGLAPKIIDDVFEKVQEINDLGVTILMIEQNIKTGVQYSDHAYLLEDGKTKFNGPADTILDRPEIREAYLKEDVEY